MRDVLHDSRFYLVASVRMWMKCSTRWSRSVYINQRRCPSFPFVVMINHSRVSIHVSIHMSIHISMHVWIHVWQNASLFLVESSISFLFLFSTSLRVSTKDKLFHSISTSFSFSTPFDSRKSLKTNNKFKSNELKEEEKRRWTTMVSLRQLIQ